MGYWLDSLLLRIKTGGLGVLYHHWTGPKHELCSDASQFVKYHPRECKFFNGRSVDKKAPFFETDVRSTNSV